MKRLSNDELVNLLRVFSYDNVTDMSLYVKKAVDELMSRRANDPTDEERHLLSLIPGVLEHVYQTAVIASAVNGTPEPVRENIDKTIAVILRLVAVQ